MSFIPAACFRAASFSLFQRSMMQQEDLPLADALDEVHWQEAFAEHQVDFGKEYAMYTPLSRSGRWFPKSSSRRSSAAARRPCRASRRCGLC